MHVRPKTFSDQLKNMQKKLLKIIFEQKLDITKHIFI